MIKKSTSYSSHWLMSQIWINLEDILNYKICSKKNFIFIKFFKEVASLFNVRICYIVIYIFIPKAQAFAVEDSIFVLAIFSMKLSVSVW